MRRFGARVLLASVLAIGAQLAGCGDVTDCPASVAELASCSTPGLSCSGGSELCTCTNGVWKCDQRIRDLSVPDLAVRDMRPIELD